MVITLTSLPLETLDDIARHLDRASLRQLALVCRALQPHPEAHLYAHIDSQDLTAWRHPFSIAPGLVDKCTQLFSALEASNQRRRSVRSVSVKLYPYHARNTISRLLSLVSCSLTTLQLQETASYFPPPCFDDLVQSLGDLHLPNLTTFEGTTSFINAALLNKLLSIAPQITTLNLGRPIFRLHKNELVPLRDDIYLPQLRRLRAEKLGLSDFPEVLKLLQISPDLVDVSLTAIAILRDSECWQPIVAHLRSSRIVQLEIDESPVWDMSGGLDSLKELTLRREHNGCYVPSLEHLTIPHLHSLEVIRYVPFNPTSASLGTSCRLVHDTESWSPDHNVPVVISTHLPFLEDLWHAPRLRTILFEHMDPNSSAAYYPDGDLAQDRIDIRRVNASMLTIECIVRCHVVIGVDGKEQHLDQAATQTWRTDVSLDDQIAGQTRRTSQGRVKAVSYGHV